MTRLLLIRTGNTFPECIERHGDFDQLFIHALGDSPVEVTMIDARHDSLPDLAGFQGVLITGSHHMVSDHEAWSDALLPFIRQMAARQLPVLGVCYGHQLIAQALGGKAGYHPDGPEVGTFTIKLTPAGQKDRLLGQLPAQFPAHLTHSQSALTLPDNAVILACNHHEPHQAFRIGEQIWGLQFHPEFNTDVCHTYLERQQQTLTELGQDVEQLHNQVQRTEAAATLIRRFATLCINPQATAS
ncbi:MAG: glutamine amidotransferase [Marinobacterium sp.]|nr:glutamine amidotransferase [Marinobacterium sp.]